MITCGVYALGMARWQNEKKKRFVAIDSVDKIFKTFWNKFVFDFTKGHDNFEIRPTKININIINIQYYLYKNINNKNIKTRKSNK